MFERYTESRKSRRRPWVALILSVSFVGHVAVASALIVAGMWQIERLMPPQRTLVIELPPRMAKASEPKPIERMKPVPRKSDRQKKLKELVQPDQNAPDREPDDDVKYASLEEIATGPDSDGEIGGTGGSGYSTGDPFGDGISFAEVNHITALPKPPKRDRVVDVDPKLLEGYRMSGNAWILPPESVRASMYRNDVKRIKGSVKLCLDKTGRPKTLRTIRSIGYKAYDRKLLREMRHWRYRPYRVDDQPVAVCTVIAFIYTMKDN